MATIAQAIRLALRYGETHLGVTDVFGEESARRSAGPNSHPTRRDAKTRTRPRSPHKVQVRGVVELSFADSKVRLRVPVKLLPPTTKE
jgi:hypothetical protein